MSGYNLLFGVKSGVNGSVKPFRTKRAINFGDLPLKERKIAIDKKSNKKIDQISDISEEYNSNDKPSTSENNAGICKISEVEKSLSILLSQGIASGDKQKLDKVLSITDVVAISATINDLSISQIIPLLKEIDTRFRNCSVQDIRPWICWAHYAINIHMHYLSTIGSLDDDLDSLFSWIKGRTSCLGKLYELKGKFNIVVEQIERRLNPQVFLRQEPLVSFSADSESSSDEFDDLDETEGTENFASDDEWWEDYDVASKDGYGFVSGGDSSDMDDAE
ncbi:unnamed protein product [Dracunculus medinensis]|uniref:Utp12 domain-containing protein n=1 Tax=Dracunculus medinensis TaxID=318479 RepID=A0A0N4UFL3_DRAME|nr:unnamed protein product [Dracunculus medinensis]